MELPLISLILSPDTPPERLVALAQEAERLELPEIWLWEDCFAQSGVAPAAAILAATRRLRVGIGLMPVPLRNVALTAMELATIARMFPGRLLPGIGHGVLDWMGQAGVRAASPLTLLREQATALRALLAGEEVTVSGRYVQLDRVRLRWPAEPAPPLFIGGEGLKTLALAGELGDGVILTGQLPPETTQNSVRTALSARAGAGLERPCEIVQFAEAPAAGSVEELKALAGRFGAAGATRLPLLAVDPEGRPAGDDGVASLIATIARA